MSRVMETIKNPEVPGFEGLLPPPPPPPPPPFPLISAFGSGDDKTIKPYVIPKISATKKATDVAGSENCTNPPVGASNVLFGDTANNVGNFTNGSTNSFANITPPAFFGQSSVTQVTQVTASEQPWWVPTDSDTADIVPAVPSNLWNDRAATWMETSPKIVGNVGKTKSKSSKRKIHAIDPVKDAEKVASAQKELSSLMKPLKCELCNAIMNSTLQAKLHYEGKPHGKKVSMYLNQSVKKPKVDDGQVTSTTSTGAEWNTYCEPCKTWFTSQVDANQHYNGKKHIRATTGASKQRLRKPKNRMDPNVDPTGRFGIGMAFLPEAQATIVPAPEVPVPTVQPIVAEPSPTIAVHRSAACWPTPTYSCDLCGVVANRLEQLETHNRGARHLKMLAMSANANKEPEEVIESAPQPTSPIIDYSIHRTPSGQYYCAPCNRSLQSENAFAQHIESKKHKTQVNPKQSPAAPLASKKIHRTVK